MYIIAESSEELEARLEITAKEAEKQGCTWSISKFHTGRSECIVSGHRVVLDPSSANPPKVGPDPSRVEKLANMEPPRNLKLVQSFLVWKISCQSFQATMRITLAKYAPFYIKMQNSYGPPSIRANLTQS